MNFDIKQLEDKIKNTFIYNNNLNISNEEKKQYIIELNYFFDLVYNCYQNNNKNKYLNDFKIEYNKIIVNGIFNCILDDIKNIYDLIYL